MSLFNTEDLFQDLRAGLVRNGLYGGELEHLLFELQSSFGAKDRKLKELKVALRAVLDGPLAQLDYVFRRGRGFEGCGVRARYPERRLLFAPEQPPAARLEAYAHREHLVRRVLEIALEECARLEEPLLPRDGEKFQAAVAQEAAEGHEQPARV